MHRATQVQYKTLPLEARLLASFTEGDLSVFPFCSVYHREREKEFLEHFQRKLLLVILLRLDDTIDEYNHAGSSLQLKWLSHRGLYGIQSDLYSVFTQHNLYPIFHPS